MPSPGQLISLWSGAARAVLGNALWLAICLIKILLDRKCRIFAVENWAAPQAAAVGALAQSLHRSPRTARAFNRVVCARFTVVFIGLRTPLMALGPRLKTTRMSPQPAAGGVARPKQPSRRSRARVHPEARTEICRCRTANHTYGTKLPTRRDPARGQQEPAFRRSRQAVK